jgi:hypothetical protein
MKLVERYPRLTQSIRQWLPIALLVAIPTTIFTCGGPCPRIDSLDSSAAGSVSSSSAALSLSGLDDGSMQNRLTGEPSPSDKALMDDLSLSDRNRELSFSPSPRLEIPGRILDEHASSSLPNLQRLLHQTKIHWFQLSSSQSNGLQALPKMPGTLGHYPDAPNQNQWKVNELQSPVIHVDGLTCACSISKLLKPTYHFDGKLGDLNTKQGGPGSTPGSSWMVLTIFQLHVSHSGESVMDPTGIPDQNLCLEPTFPSPAPTGPTTTAENAPAL